MHTRKNPPERGPDGRSWMTNLSTDSLERVRQSVIGEVRADIDAEIERRAAVERRVRLKA
jgi:hypothetical protein